LSTLGSCRRFVLKAFCKSTFGDSTYCLRTEKFRWFQTIKASFENLTANCQN
jgi:hypothetical protein